MKIAVRTESKEKKGHPRTKRVQTVLTIEQYELLLQAAKQAGETVSALVRKAIETGPLAQELQRKRERAFEELLSLDAPVSAWEQMEKEIAEGAGRE